MALAKVMPREKVISYKQLRSFSGCLNANHGDPDCLISQWIAEAVARGQGPGKLAELELPRRRLARLRYRQAHTGREAVAPGMVIRSGLACLGFVAAKVVKYRDWLCRGSQPGNLPYCQLTAKRAL
jgi:hypothetical protein